MSSFTNDFDENTMVDGIFPDFQKNMDLILSMFPPEMRGDLDRLIAGEVTSEELIHSRFTEEEIRKGKELLERDYLKDKVDDKATRVKMEMLMHLTENYNGETEFKNIIKEDGTLNIPNIDLVEIGEKLSKIGLTDEEIQAYENNFVELKTEELTRENEDELNFEDFEEPCSFSECRNLPLNENEIESENKE